MRSHQQSQGQNDMPRLPTATAGPVAVQTATLEDAGAQAAMQPWIEMEYYQLSRGSRVGDIESLDLGALQVVREGQHAAVQKLGATPANLCTISFCTPDPGFRFSDRRSASATEIFLMPEQTAFDLFVPAGAQTTYVSLDQAAFLRDARALNPRSFERAPQQVMTFHTPHQAAFADALSVCFAAAGSGTASGPRLDSRGIARAIFLSALHLVSAASADAFTPLAGWRSFRICRKARAFVEDRHDAEGVPSVADLCAATGVSERSLQYAFRDYIGMSPVTYLRLCRLNRARAALLEADPQASSVTEIAMHFGFEHLGRFAGDYRRLFDETPSATLAG